MTITATLTWLPDPQHPGILDSACNRYRLQPIDGGWKLTLFEHRDDDGNVQVRRFATLGAAKCWAENS